MAKTPEPIRFVAIPKKTKFQIEIEDPSDSDKTILQDYFIYHKGAGCPMPVVIDTEQLFIDYDNMYPTPEQRESMTTTEYLQAATKANLILYRDLLMTVTYPQMSADIANILVNDPTDEAGLKLLVMSGWRAEPVAMPSQEEETEEDKSEEAPKGEDVTGE